MIRRRFVYPSLAAAAAVGAVVTLLPTASQALTLQGEFDKLDANKDGFVAAQEFKAPPEGFYVSKTSLPGQDVKPMVVGEGEDKQVALHRWAIETVDADADQKLNFAEFRVLAVNAARHNFTRMDRNGDEKVTKAEYTVIPIMRRDAKGKLFQEVATSERIAQIPGLAERYAELEQRFIALDRDRNGVLTRAEFTLS